MILSINKLCGYIHRRSHLLTFLSVYICLMGLQVACVFACIYMMVHHQLFFTRYLIIIIIFLFIFLASLIKTTQKFWIRFCMYMTSILMTIFILNFVGTPKWLDPQMPVLKIQDVTHPTNIDNIRYFKIHDQWELEKKYGSLLSWEWAPTPEGFEISPQQADFIYSSILRNGGHFGWSASSTIYYDSHSYYVSEYYNIHDDYESLFHSTTRI